MRLLDVMTKQVETVAPSAPVDGLRERMALFGIHHLVVSSAGKIVGVVSARDLIAPSGATIEEVMQPDPIVARRDTTIRRAANMMRGNRIGSLPIVDERGRVIGIVTISDLLELIGRGIEKGRRPTLPRRGARRRNA